MRLILLHDDGKKYFEALAALEAAGEISVETYHTHFLKMFVKGIVRFNAGMAAKAAASFFFYLRSFFISNETIMLSLAPYDSTLLFWRHLQARNSIIYQTSWPYWSDGAGLYEPGIFRGLIKGAWSAFINNARTYVVCVISRTKNEIMKKYGKDRDKIFVIPHVVNLDNFRPLSRKNKSMKVLYTGRLVREKGLEDLARVIEGSDEKKFSFGIAGDGRDKYLLDGVLKRKNVTYYGNVGDRKKMAEIMRKHEVFILPSYRTGTWEELFGMVVIEAFASGLAVIATDCVGPSEIIKNGKNGILVKQRDYKGMLKKLGYLRENSAVMKKMAFCAVKSAEKYGVKRITGLWRRVLLNAGSGRGKR